MTRDELRQSRGRRRSESESARAAKVNFASDSAMSFRELLNRKNLEIDQYQSSTQSLGLDDPLCAEAKRPSQALVLSLSASSRHDALSTGCRAATSSDWPYELSSLPLRLLQHSTPAASA